MFKFRDSQVIALIGLFLLLVSLLFCQSAFAVKRALVIGNTDYGNGAGLGPAPINDARDFGQMLQSLGFAKSNIKLALDIKTPAEFKQIINRFAQKISNKDEVIVYYSGHGVQSYGVNYLIPTQSFAAVSVPAHLETEALALEPYLMSAIEYRQPRVSLFFLDACRDNPFKSLFKSVDSKNGLGEFGGPSGSLVSYAQSSGKKALIFKRDRNSLFTKHLLRELKSGGNLSDVLTRVRLAVRKESGNAQEPVFLSALNDFQYCLNDNDCKPKRVVQLPKPVAQEPDPEPVKITSPIVRKQSFEPEMQYIKGGSFDMGDLSKGKVGYKIELPVHKVSMGDFWVGKTEITFAQWNVCVKAGVCQKAGDQGWGQGERPVININWNDTQDYIGWLNTKTGKSYRLLSESEWEYVARAGSRTQYSWGDELDCKKAQYRDCGAKTKPVGSFAPNAFGLYDLHGNVYEWVEDCWNGSYRNAPVDGSAWREGECSIAVLRGGSWSSSAWNLRSANRDGYARSGRDGIIGFRLAMTR